MCPYLSRYYDKEKVDSIFWTCKIQTKNPNQARDKLRKRNQITIAESYSGYSKNKVTKIREEQTHDIKHDSKTIPTTESHQKQFAKDKDNPTGNGA